MPDAQVVIKMKSNYAFEVVLAVFTSDRRGLIELYNKTKRRIATTVRGNIMTAIPGLFLDGEFGKEPSICLGFVGKKPVLVKRVEGEEAEALRPVLLDNINHPSIVRHTFYKDGTNIIVVMAQLPQSLVDLREFNDPTVAGDVIAEILPGLKFLHGKKLAHFDIKPDNICLTTSGRAVLIDVCSVAELSSFSYRTTVAYVPTNMPGRKGDVFVVSRLHDFYMLALTVLSRLQPIPTQRSTRAEVQTQLSTCSAASHPAIQELLDLIRVEETAAGSSLAPTSAPPEPGTSSRLPAVKGAHA